MWLLKDLEKFTLRDHSNGTLNSNTYRGIAPNDFQTVLFEPLSGLLTQPYFFPLRYCPITIELELVSDYETPVISKFSDEPAAGDLAANEEFLE